MAAIGNDLNHQIIEKLRGFFTQDDELYCQHIFMPLVRQSEETSSYYPLLQQIIPEEVSQVVLLYLVRELTSKTSITDADLSFFEFILRRLTPDSNSTHFKVLEFLNKWSNSNSKSTKFGKLILEVIKLLGRHLSSTETLNYIVNSHSSSMRKALEVNVKKLR